MLLDTHFEIANRRQTHAMTVIGGQKLGGRGLSLGATIFGRRTIIAQLLQAQQKPVIQSLNQASQPVVLALAYPGTVPVPVPRPWGVQNTPNAVWE